MDRRALRLPCVLAIFDSHDRLEALMDHTLRFRQIHLDFHTSEQIACIGSLFDADKFADTLDRARSP
ncbi:MAG: hypothetical protein CME19_19435 [Gemmatimonadetes bacterium]|nr:hypothetical protein [Gemmatimonadota bacterium]